MFNYARHAWLFASFLSFILPTTRLLLPSSLSFPKYDVYIYIGASVRLYWLYSIKDTFLTYSTCCSSIILICAVYYLSMYSRSIQKSFICHTALFVKTTGVVITLIMMKN